MFSRKLAVLAAASLLFASTASVAQTTRDSTTPTSGTTLPSGSVETPRGFFQSDLFVMLGALLGAALITVLATQIGHDDPASP